MYIIKHISQLLLILFVTIGCILAELQAHVSTFVIDAGSKNEVTAELSGESVSAICKLEYDTNIAKQKDETKEWPPAITLIDQMSKKYGCMVYEEGMFKYEVCLGEDIRQTATNDDRYSLGKYEKVVEGFTYTQTYTKGTYCEAAHTDRKSVVEFVCGEQVHVNSVAEHAVCQYRIILAVPEVCGHPQFSGTINKPETWVLELSETDEGAVMCQAYNNGLDTVGTLTFQTFTLSIDTTGYSLSSYVVRNMGRKHA
jgi:hypothetical protein